MAYSRAESRIDNTLEIVWSSSSEDERSFARSFACVADLFEVLVGRFVFVLGMAREGCRQCGKCGAS